MENIFVPDLTHPRRRRRIEVTGPVTDPDNFKWKDARDWPLPRQLCYLEPHEVAKYLQIHFWLTYALQPILRHPSVRNKKGWDWEAVFHLFLQQNPWNTLTGYRSLSSTHDRRRSEMRALIALHNQRVAGQSLEQRVERTREFLRLPRDPPRMDRDLEEEGEAEEYWKEPKITLIAPDADIIVFWDEQTPDGRVERREVLFPPQTYDVPVQSIPVMNGPWPTDNGRAQVLAELAAENRRRRGVEIEDEEEQEEDAQGDQEEEEEDVDMDQEEEEEDGDDQEEGEEGNGQEKKEESSDDSSSNDSSLR